VTQVTGIKWFLNEDCYPYDYPAEYQEAQYPGDFHTPYDSYEEAMAASLVINPIVILSEPDHA
jgi:hypothetical protein